MSSPRAVAASIIHRVMGGHSLNRLLPTALDATDEAQRPLCQELVYGTLREWPYLTAICQGFLAKPLRRKDQDVMALLCVGIYELERLNTPAHAVVSETVNAARSLKKSWATGVINGVLRSFQRATTPADTLSVAEQRALPMWLHDRLTAEYGDGIEQIALAARTRPPMALRVNRQSTLREDYLKTLTTAGVSASACVSTEDGVVLERPMDVTTVPGFLDGAASVQDSAAQHVAHIMAPQPGERILDACAAPGGKACHLLELQPALEELIAADVSAPRLQRVLENSARLGITLTTAVADASALPDTLLARPFDAILADVPCSATGVLRRNPDIKILRQSDDVDGFARQQLAILQGLWPALAVDGRLLYVTCSLLQAENDDVIARFTASNGGAVVEPLQLSEGLARQYGWQTLPDPKGGDGLYFSLLRKAAG